jgi:phospholipid-binding lipoprotein MlaA
MQDTTFNARLTLSSLVISSILAGCASTAETVPNPNDPWQNWNRGTQKFNDNLDKAILKPLAKGYQKITPKPVDDSITNFFSNINDIGVTVNDLMQFKMLQSGKDLSRFVVNSTAGVAGFFDVATKIDLPKHNEDFGQTLGYWGVPSGNYLVLPFFGSSSPRETAGLIGDALLNPLTYVSIFGGAAASAATSGARVVDVTDTRSDVMATEKIVDEASVDRYDFRKNAYQQRREYLIHDGNPPSVEDDEFDLSDETGSEEGKGGKGVGTAPNSNGGAPVTDNSSKMPSTHNSGPAPVTNNSRHLLQLSAPEKE